MTKRIYGFLKIEMNEESRSIRLCFDSMLYYTEDVMCFYCFIYIADFFVAHTSRLRFIP